jgi:hypothetical protein
MKIFTWLLNWQQAKRLKNHRSQYTLKLETELCKSACIMEIQTAIEPLWLSIDKLVYKLSVKSVQQVRILTSRDMFDKQKVLHHPLFCQTEIAEFLFKYILYGIVIVSFIVAESFLYNLTASLFLPGGAEYMKIAVSIFLALLIMMALNFGLEKHILYRQVMEQYGKQEGADIALKKYLDMRNLGYLLIVLSFASIILAGLARINFLEFIPAKGLSPEKLKSVQSASKASSLFTLAVTVITAILMGLLKQEQAKLGIKFRLFRYWYRTHTRHNQYAQQLIRDANKILILVDQRIEKHWQLTIDLKRVCEAEYDTSYEQQQQKYLNLKNQPGFAVTDDLYARFAPLQSAHEELFKYGVRYSKEIKEIIAFAISARRVPKEHIAEYLKGTQKTVPDAEPLLPAPESNGKPKDYHFSTI